MKKTALALLLTFTCMVANAEWVADLAGFVIGFAMSTLLVPGGWAKLVDRLRQRN